MNTIRNYYYPASIKEALSLLANDNTEIIAGGTHITTSTQIKPRLVDITRLKMNYITEEEQEIIIGSTTTITEILESPLTTEIGNGILTKACSLIGDTPLRNTITLGGSTDSGGTGNTGAASNDENRPPYYDVVWIMRIK